MKETLKETEKPADKVIQERVLRRLGRPPGLHSVEVKHLWGKKYRVNVWTKTDTGEVMWSYSLQHSYFITMSEGNIMKANPPIERVYHKGESVEDSTKQGIGPKSHHNGASK
jgi:hypothetical protein